MGRRDDHRAGKWAERQRRENRRRDPRRGAWESRIKAVGLRIETRNKHLFKARGSRQSTRFRVTGTRDEDTWTWALEASHKHVPDDLVIVPERGRSWLVDLLGRPDQVVGDPVLDDLARIEGPPDRLLAALDETTRQRLRSLVGQGGSVRDRSVRLSLTSDDARPAWLPDRILDLTRLAVRLGVHPKRVAPNLVQAVDRDSLPGIRDEAFRILMRDHPTRVPDRLMTQERLLPLLDELSNETLVLALQALARVGSSTALPLIAPYARFPRGNNASRKAAKQAGKAIAERTAPEGGLMVSDERAAPDGGLALSGEPGGLAPVDD